MTAQAKGTLQIKGWDEKLFKKLTGSAKLTRATVTQSLAGDIKGESTVEYLMAYRSKTSATFCGLQHVKGRLGGRSGSFTLQVTGTFEDGIAKGKWSVITGLGTGGLSALRGTGSFKAPMGCEASFTFKFDFTPSD